MHSDSRPVERFFRVLIDEIEGRNAAYLEHPFTVAEIYQTLIPYRTHRDRLGVEMNGDYEDTLLRLLSGEGEFLFLESEAARKRIRLELEESNPNTGIYREYAAVGVRVNPERAPRRAPSDTGSGSAAMQTSLDPFGPGEAESPVATSPGNSAAVPRSVGVPAVRSAAAAIPAAPSAPPSKRDASGQNAATAAGFDQRPGEGESATAACPDCGEGLPSRENLRFCPNCGSNVLHVPCSACGEILERRWKFCVACGAPAR